MTIGDPKSDPVVINRCLHCGRGDSARVFTFTKRYMNMLVAHNDAVQQGHPRYPFNHPDKRIAGKIYRFWDLCPTWRGISGFSNLAYWNLIEPHPEDGYTVDPDTGRRYWNKGGFWVLSERGKKFLAGRTLIYGSLLVYQAKVVEVGGALVHRKSFLVDDTGPRSRDEAVMTMRKVKREVREQVIEEKLGHPSVPLAFDKWGKS